MTKKQERILNAGLKLFATQGYSSTSTSQVARAAEVSEGLIFRHFKNKEGLLNAILEEGKSRTREIFADVVLTSDPKERIRKMIRIPFEVPEDQYEMWRLIYALKWQTNRYEEDYQEAVKASLGSAFKALNYSDPQAEVEVLFMLLDGAATAFLLHNPKPLNAIRHCIMNKYNL